MSDALAVKARFPVAPERILAAWLDPEQHAEMTGAGATGEGRVGAAFTAWDGYIEGTTLVVEPGRIVQAWRTAEFPEGAPDSRLEVIVTAISGGCEVSIAHTEIPDGQGPRYEQGWMDFYFSPMASVFGAWEGA